MILLMKDGTIKQMRIKQFCLRGLRADSVTFDSRDIEDINTCQRRYGKDFLQGFMLELALVLR